MSNSLVEEILAAAGQPVSGDRLTVEQIQLAINEKRVLRVHSLSVEGDVEAWFGIAIKLAYYSGSRTVVPYIVFPTPIPRALRMRKSGIWDDIAEVYAAFGIFGD